MGVAKFKSTLDIVEFVKCGDGNHVPRAGDFFVIQRQEMPPVPCRVVKAGVKGPGIECALVYVYESPQWKVENIRLESCKTLRLPPMLINTASWSKGFFKTVGNRALKKQEMLRRHVFLLYERMGEAKDDRWQSVWVDEERSVVPPPKLGEPHSYFGACSHLTLRKLLT